MDTLERYQQNNAAAHPPGPRGMKLIRAVNDYRRSGIAVLERLAAEYGDVLAIRLPGLRAFLINHPALVQQVLLTNRDNYLKSPGSKNVRRFFGNPMQLDNGEYARRLRMLLAPAFQPDRAAAAYSELIRDATQRRLAAWQDGPHPGLTRELMELTLEIAVRIHFGTELGGETQAMGKLFLAAMSSLRNFMLPAWAPTPANRRYHASVAALDAEVFRLIRARRQGHDERPDLLTTFARLSIDGMPALSEGQIRDEVITMMSAGYQSVAIALNQTLRLTAENPAVEAALAAELDRVLGESPPMAANLAQLCYVSKIVKEALRCCPPAGVIDRRAVMDDVIDGWRIPAGARVFISAWALHRDPRFYEDPLVFNPDRWTPEFERGLPACAYLPFGRGPRSCIAGSLATLIVQLMLVTIAQRFRLKAPHQLPAAETAWPNVLRAGGVQITIHQQSSRRRE